jgi:hypothetical protein
MCPGRLRSRYKSTNAFWYEPQREVIEVFDGAWSQWVRRGERPAGTPSRPSHAGATLSAAWSLWQKRNTQGMRSDGLSLLHLTEMLPARVIRWKDLKRAALGIDAMSLCARSGSRCMSLRIRVAARSEGLF